MKYSDFAKALRSLLPENLPGVEAQLKMAPSMREIELNVPGIGQNAVPCGVLLLFYPDSGGWAKTVLMRRPSYDGPHSSQVSFPGGRYEQGDKSLEYTALRETHEEIGVHQNQIEIVGNLTELFIPPTNYMVSPFLALSARMPVFAPNCREVASLIEVKVSELFNLSNIGVETIRLHGDMTLQTPCYYLNGNVVWGATAMIISELVEYLKRNPNGFYAL